MSKVMQGPLPVSGDDSPKPEVYTPTQAERERGKWAVVFELKDEDGMPDINSTPHIIPTFGVNHEISEFCWCQPEKDTRRNGDDCFVHSPSQ